MRDETDGGQDSRISKGKSLVRYWGRRVTLFDLRHVFGVLIKALLSTAEAAEYCSTSRRAFSLPLYSFFMVLQIDLDSLFAALKHVGLFEK